MSDDPTIDAPRPTLVEHTRELLCNRRRTLTLRDIESQTKIPVDWLSKFANGTHSDPAASRVQKLYEFLAGKMLEY